MRQEKVSKQRPGTISQAEGVSHATPRHHLRWSYVTLFAVVWLSYVLMHNGETITDSLMASTFIPCLFQGHGIDLSAANLRTDLLATQPYYYWNHAKYGLIGMYPIGMSLLAAPIQIPLWLFANASGLDISLHSPFFNNTRAILEKITASFLAAATVLPLLASLKLLVSRRTALLVTLIYICASSSLSLLAQGLWQQTGVNLITMTLVYLVLRYKGPLKNSHESLFFFATGFLFTIRPTALLWSVFVALLYYRNGGRPSLNAFLGFTLGLLPGLAWNWEVHENLIGGYAVTRISNFDWSPVNWLSRVGPLLFSPHKGLFVFNPLLLGLVGSLFALRRLDPRARTIVGLLLVAVGCQFLLCLTNPNWHGGRGFGPRYLAEGLGVWFLLSAIGIETLSSWLPRINRIMVIFIGAYSLALHVFGALGGRINAPMITAFYQSMLLP